MQVELLFFGVLKDVVGTEHEALDLGEGETVGGILRILEARTSNGCSVWGSLAVAVNREYAGRETVVQEGDEIALLPPVSGGLEMQES